MRSNKSKLLEFKKVLKKFKEKKIFLGILGSPDPDGIGSAFGLKEILTKEKIKADILTFERISRPDNTEFVKKLEIEMKCIESASELEIYDGYMIVDRQSPELPFKMNKNIPLIAHIDHHYGTNNFALFNDIRVNVGSTSTIITSYFRSGFYPLDNQNPINNKIAAALLFGIRTDTDDFFNATKADFMAASYLSFFSDHALLKKIFYRPAGKAFLETLKNALSCLKRNDEWLTTFVGKVPKYARDSIGQTADFLMHSDAVSTVIVYGIVGSSVIGSMRTADESIEPNLFLKEALTNTFGKHTNCGGRKWAGGFLIPLESFPVPKNSDKGNIIFSDIDELLQNLLHKPKQY